MHIVTDLLWDRRGCGATARIAEILDSSVSVEEHQAKLLSFFQTVGQVRAPASSAYHYITKMRSHEWIVGFHELQLSFSFLYIMPHFLSWLLILLIYSNFTFHQILSTVATTSYSVLLITDPLLCHLELFFCPKWTLNDREIHTR